MKILICVSGMPYAKPILQYGRLLATLQESEITLLTVTDKSDTVAPGAMLKKAKSYLNVPVSCLKVKYGHPIPEIVQETREVRYDIVIIGLTIARRFLDSWLNDISQKIAEQLTTSVLIVKEAEPKLKRILVCTGGHEQLSQVVVMRGATLAQLAQAELKLLHVLSPIPEIFRGLVGMEESLQQILASHTPVAQHLQWANTLFEAMGIQAETILHKGVVIDEIQGEVVENSYDLIVVGAHTQMGLLERWLMRNVDSQIIAQIPCSILMVRNNEGE